MSPDVIAVQQRDIIAAQIALQVPALQVHWSVARMEVREKRPPDSHLAAKVFAQVT